LASVDKVLRIQGTSQIEGPTDRMRWDVRVRPPIN
jgi:hypothetical protein